MQPPEEQSLKPEEMDTETPLLVLKPSPDKVRKKLIVNVFFFAVFLEGSLRFIWNDWGHMSFLEIMKNVLLCVFVFFYGIKIIDTLSIRSFKLYLDRVSKNYIFGERVIYLEDVKIFISISTNYFFSSCLYVTARSGIFCNFWNKITYDLGLGDNSRADVNDIVGLCNSVGIEFKKKSGFFSEKYEQIWKHEVGKS